MFQTINFPGWYGRVLQPLKYRTIWRPDSNILSSMDVINFMTWKGPCMDCETPNRSGVGLFYSNSLRLRKCLPPCHAVWWREFYRPHPEDPFWLQTSLADRDNAETMKLQKGVWVHFLYYKQMVLKIHARGKRIMGVVRSKDKVLTVNQLLLIGEIAEKYWWKSNSEEE